MTEKKKTTKGKKAVQSKKEDKKTPIVINMEAQDLYAEILTARQKAGARLSIEEMAYLWTKELAPLGITITVGERTFAKPSWLKQLSRWIKSLASKF